jgi:hypothetical protein
VRFAIQPVVPDFHERVTRFRKRLEVVLDHLSASVKRFRSEALSSLTLRTDLAAGLRGASAIAVPPPIVSSFGLIFGLSVLRSTIES